MWSRAEDPCAGGLGDVGHVVEVVPVGVADQHGLGPTRGSVDAGVHCQCGIGVERPANSPVGTG